MRDANDPGTQEMPLPKKRGRPTKYTSGPLSAAERARNYRERVSIDARQVAPMLRLEYAGVHVSEPDGPLRDSAILAALRAAVSCGDNSAIHNITECLRERYPIA